MQRRSLDLEGVSYWLRCPSVCQQASVHSFRKRRGCGMRLVESKRAESGEFRTMTPAFCPLLGLIYCTRSTALGLLFTNTCSHHISEQLGADQIRINDLFDWYYMPTLVTAVFSDCNKNSCIEKLIMIVMLNNYNVVREKIIEFIRIMESWEVYTFIRSAIIVNQRAQNRSFHLHARGNCVSIQNEDGGLGLTYCVVLLLLFIIIL